MKSKIYSLSEFSVKKHRTKLKNGLDVIFLEKPYAPIYAELMMRAGTVFNSTDNGLAHFTEHIIVSGSKKYPLKEDFAKIIASVGGYANAFTSSCEMSIECEVASREHMKNMKKYFSEALTGLQITNASLAKEKGVIASEIEGRLSDSRYRYDMFLMNVLGKFTKYSYSTLGAIKNMLAITTEEVEKFFSTFCCVENMLLVIAGGCTLSDVEKTFSNIRFIEGERADLPSDPKILQPNQRIFFNQDINQTRINLFLNGPTLNTRESIILHYALNLAHTGLTSRFYKKIRNERGLAYGVGLFTRSFNNLRYIGTSVGTPTNKIDQTITAIIECYQELLEEGITQKQLDDSRKCAWFSKKRNMERAIDWISEFDDLYESEQQLIGDFPDYYNFIQTITPSEVMDVLRKYITLDNFHLAISGKEPSKKYF